MFEHSITIPQEAIENWLKSVPTCTAVFALFGPDAHSEPYISKTANLRRRLHRLLAPRFAGTKTLHLGGRIERVEYSEVGSRFATALLLLQATRKFCGSRAQERLHIRPPSLLRFASENAHPRVYVTNKIAQRALTSTYGPFQSRTSAERFLDDSLNFFELRRCNEDLNPDPAFPGCVYSEMKMCLAPCFRGCTEERYAAEADQVREYLASRGSVTIAQLERERELASGALDFETAARLHQRVEKMKTVTQQAAPLVHAIADLNAIIVQPASQQQFEGVATPERTEKLSNRALQSQGAHVAIFLVREGRIFGPGLYSVEGMRHPNERSGSTSLFAHPTLLEPVPLDASSATASSTVSGATHAPRGQLEQRLQSVIDRLEAEGRETKFSADLLGEHLSLLARWYYRPPARRIGEIFFPSTEAPGSADERTFPLSRVLRGISRVFCGQKDPENMAQDAVLSVEPPSFSPIELKPEKIP